MKNITQLHRAATTGLLICSVLFVALILSGGCASEPSPPAASKAPPLPAGVTLHQDKDINGVWLAPEFNFKGYDTVYVADPMFAAVERTNEVAMRAMAMKALSDQMVEHIRKTEMFPVVTTQTNELKPDARKLILENTIIEYEKGGGGARFWAGLYGAGQPVIKVRGRILDGDKLMCVYEMRRSGESGGARVFGGYKNDEDIQRNDIRDLASDFADFIKRTAAK